MSEEEEYTSHSHSVVTESHICYISITDHEPQDVEERGENLINTLSRISYYIQILQEHHIVYMDSTNTVKVH